MRDYGSHRRVCSVCVVSVLRIDLVPLVQSIVVCSNVEYLWR